MPHLPDDIAEDLLLTPSAQSTLREKQGPQNLEELSRYAVRQALQSSRGNISLAARTLGISRQTLYRKMGDQ